VQKLSSLIALALLWSGQASANLITNGDFESPAGSSYQLTSANPPSSWSYSGTGADYYSANGGWGISAQGGSYYIGLGHNGSTGGRLTQDFTATVGNVMHGEFWLSTQQYQQSNNPLEQLDVRIINLNNNSVVYQHAFSIFDQVWTKELFDFVAPSASLRLQMTDITTAQNSGPVNFGLDTVSLEDTGVTGPSNVPEPASLALLGVGLFGARVFGKRRKRS